MRQRSGIVVYVVVGILAFLVIVAFSLFSMMRDESLRVHRVYYGTAAIKIAEAVEAEALCFRPVFISTRGIPAS